MRADVFVLGSFVADVSFRAERLPVQGETLLGSRFALGPGGKGSNQAVACARAGASVTLLTAVADDAFGALGRSLWSAEGIDASYVKTATVPTGAAAILLDDRTGENAIIIVPGACSTLTPEDVDAAAEVIRTSAVFLAQLEVPLPAVQRGLEIARGAGVVTVLNPAPAPAGALPSDVLALVDFLVPNETEIGQLTKSTVSTVDEAVKAARDLRADGAGSVLVTLGERGAILCGAAGDPLSIEAVAAGPVIDTTGAGDAFCGSFAAALAAGSDVCDAARFASFAAGLSVTRHGTAESMPTREEIEALRLRLQ